uniref:Transmembrane protein 209 n=1 Tax=Davidia involucrata TaxID=16924 RepID=A0A5B7BZM2_DAVIN
MDGGGGGRDKGPPPLKPSKFSVYQNPALSAALTSNSLRPSKSTFLCILSLSTASAFALLSIISRESGIIDTLKLRYVSKEVTYLLAKAIQTMMGLILIGTMLALFKAISLWRARNAAGVTVISPSKGTKEQTCLTNRQLGLLGIRPKVEQVVSEPSKKPPKSKFNSVSPSDFLVPLHQPITSSSRSSRLSSNKSNTSGGSKIHSFSTPSKSPGSSSPLYLVSQLPSVQTSPGLDQLVATPWSNKQASSTKEITTEEKLEQFLADVAEKISESAVKLATPPPTISGFGIATPNTISSSANTSGTRRSTPLRPVRMSPGSQKFSTPPKKGEGDLPPHMSMEESIEAFEHLGIYPQIEQWRDHLRQWFSSVLLNPVLNKIEASHIQVMQAAAKLGISITINQMGTDLPTTGTSATVSPIERTSEWQPAFTLDEDGLLHQLRVTLDAFMSKLPAGNLQQSPQQNSLIPLIQECINAIAEHQRLHALMKGEWVKGLLPQSSVRADYTVQRIRELAEGTCLKNYEYLGSGEVYDKVNKKRTLELPTDSHLLLYLFCAFLEHPKWMLHVDSTSYAGAQSSKNPLFLGVLPPKERFPEKYLAVISGVPSVLHPGACILAVGKQSPPIFALYWDKKPQFSLQGRTALWDSILLLCHRINIGYGGVVRGMHLGSSALGILPVLDTETEE